MSEETDRIGKILAANAEKDFVKRILDPEGSPSIDMGGGKRGTHFMASGEADGKFYAYPTIQRMSDGSLKKMEANEAFQEAFANGELIEFGSDEEAKWFAANYKKVWEEESDLKGKPLVDEIIKNQKPLPKAPMKPPERARGYE